MMSSRFFLLFLFSCVLSGSEEFTTSRTQENGIRMSIYGRAFDKDKNDGVANLMITIANTTTNDIYHTYSDSDGRFTFRAVNAGNYELINSYIYSSLRIINMQNLILEAESDKNIKFNVIEGKNIIDFNIFFIRGSKISGRVFGPDGKSPIQNAEILLNPYIEGQKPITKSDDNGNFIFEGLKKTTNPQDGTNTYSLVVEAYGYADVMSSFYLEKTGVDKTGMIIILGKGISNIYGRVIDKKNKAPIHNALVDIMSAEGKTENFLSGSAKTNINGEFSIIGFQDISKLDIAIFFNEKSYQFSRDLSSGDNNFIFELDDETDNILPLINSESSSSYVGPMSGEFYYQNSQTNSCELTKRYQPRTFNCAECAMETDVQNAFKNMCDVISSSDIKCFFLNIGASKECMCNACNQNPKVIFWCTECAMEPNYNRDDPNETIIPCAQVGPGSTIVICTNGEGRCNLISLTEKIFHELYHICDTEGGNIYCIEARAWEVTACVFKTMGRDGPTIRRLKKKCRRYSQTW